MQESPNEKRTKTAVAGVCACVGLLALVWWFAIRNAQPSADSPEELLRKATAAKSTTEAKPTGKVVSAQGKTETGTPVRATMTEIVDKNGQKSFVLSLPQPLKEGEAAMLKMPNGGGIEVSHPKEGQKVGPGGRPAQDATK